METQTTLFNFYLGHYQVIHGSNCPKCGAVLYREESNYYGQITVHRIYCSMKEVFNKCAYQHLVEG